MGNIFEDTWGDFWDMISGNDQKQASREAIEIQNKAYADAIATQIAAMKEQQALEQAFQQQMLDKMLAENRVGQNLGIQAGQTQMGVNLANMINQLNMAQAQQQANLPMLQAQQGMLAQSIPNIMALAGLKPVSMPNTVQTINYGALANNVIPSVMSSISQLDPLFARMFDQNAVQGGTGAPITMTPNQPQQPATSPAQPNAPGAGQPGTPVTAPAYAQPGTQNVPGQTYVNSTGQTGTPSNSSMFMNVQGTNGSPYRVPNATMSPVPSGSDWQTGPSLPGVTGYTEDQVRAARNQLMNDFGSPENMLNQMKSSGGLGSQVDVMKRISSDPRYAAAFQKLPGETGGTLSVASGQPGNKTIPVVYNPGTPSADQPGAYTTNNLPPGVSLTDFGGDIASRISSPRTDLPYAGQNPVLGIDQLVNTSPINYQETPVDIRSLVMNNPQYQLAELASNEALNRRLSGTGMQNSSDATWMQGRLAMNNLADAYNQAYNKQMDVYNMAMGFQPMRAAEGYGQNFMNQFGNVGQGLNTATSALQNAAQGRSDLYSNQAQQGSSAAKLAGAIGQLQGQATNNLGQGAAAWQANNTPGSIFTALGNAGRLYGAAQGFGNMFSGFGGGNSADLDWFNAATKGRWA